MKHSTEFKAFLTRDRSHIVMMDGDWRHRIPVAELPIWIEHHRWACARRAKTPGQPGPSAPAYQPGLDALLAVQRQLAGGAP